MVVAALAPVDTVDGLRRAEHLAGRAQALALVRGILAVFVAVAISVPFDALAARAAMVVGRAEAGVCNDENRIRSGVGAYAVGASTLRRFIRVAAYYFHANVCATTQHTFDNILSLAHVRKYVLTWLEHSRESSRRYPEQS